MKRPQIVEQIRKALAQVVPDAQAILYGSEARGEARPDSDIDLLILVDGVLLKKIWENRPFQTPFIFNVMKEGIVL